MKRSEDRDSSEKQFVSDRQIPESGDHDSRHLREDDVHCGIFWDIENVRHE